MIAVGLFMLVCGTIRSEFLIYRLLVARSRHFWSDRKAIHRFYQFSGLMISVRGTLSAMDIIWRGSSIRGGMMRFLLTAVVVTVTLGGCSHKVTIENLESLRCSTDHIHGMTVEEVKETCGPPDFQNLIKMNEGGAKLFIKYTVVREPWEENEPWEYTLHFDGRYEASTLLTELKEVVPSSRTYSDWIKKLCEENNSGGWQYVVP